MRKRINMAIAMVFFFFAGVGVVLAGVDAE